MQCLSSCWHCLWYQKRFHWVCRCVMTVFRKWRSEVGLSRFNKEVSAVSCLVFFWFVCLVCFGFFFSEITISFIISLSQKKKKTAKIFSEGPSTSTLHILLLQNNALFSSFACIWLCEQGGCTPGLHHRDQLPAMYQPFWEMVNAF